jgi:glycosyltransferase involved in cell wall biosynthesis
LVLKSNCTVLFKIIGADADGISDSYSSNSEIRENIQFLGKVKNDELINAYQNCDIFVAPSYYESFGLIYAEAMAWGKPVIGTKVGGIPDVVDDNKNGILVPPGNEIELASAIIRLADSHELRSSMGLAGRKRIKENFSVEEMARRSVQHYGELLLGKKY